MVPQEPSSGPTLRRTIHYSGRVQGVGFRQTSWEIAASFDVAGQVRNLPDGRVELIAEGDGAEIAAFQEAIAARMGSNIRGFSAVDSPPSGLFIGFRIAR